MHRQGIYIYSADGRSRRAVADNAQMSYYGGASSMMARGPGSLVYVYVTYGKRINYVCNTVQVSV